MHMLRLLRAGCCFTFLLVITAAGGGENPSVKTRAVNSTCTVLATWADARIAAGITRLDDLRALPTAWRRAVVSRLPMAAQHALWATHLNEISTVYGSESVEGRVAAKTRLLLPQLFDPQVKTSARAAMARDLWMQTLPALGRSRSVMLLSSLGSAAASTSRSNSIDTDSRFSRGAVFAADPLLPMFALNGMSLCVCNTFYQDCYSAPECTESNNPHCEHTEQGCGPMWLAPCDGNCNS
jgi:hypothetical protein